MRLPPTRIVGDGLVLRCWSEEFAVSLKDAVDSSLEELQEWMPWAPSEPEPVEEVKARLAKRREDFIQGRDFFYLILDPTETAVLGCTGLHPRAEAGALEIGYWIRTDHTGRGLATEATRVLTRTALEAVGARRVEIRCDPENKASAAIPERLGYVLIEVLLQNTTSVSGALRDTMVWEMTAERLGR
jgi:RimJ/RimL family protein N-acetyltransferase